MNPALFMYTRGILNRGTHDYKLLYETEKEVGISHWEGRLLMVYTIEEVLTHRLSSLCPEATVLKERCQKGENDILIQYKWLLPLEGPYHGMLTVKVSDDQEWVKEINVEESVITNVKMYVILSRIASIDRLTLDIWKQTLKESVLELPEYRLLHATGLLG